jgi:hypothetical protein
MKVAAEPNEGCATSMKRAIEEPEQAQNKRIGTQLTRATDEPE